MTTSSNSNIGLHGDLRRVADCELVGEEESRSRYSTDFGQLVRKTPSAVVRVGSVEAVQRIIRYAATNGVRVSTRGTGHSLGGQSLADGGIVLDVSGLNRIYEVRADHLWFEADAGTIWAAVIAAAAPKGVLPRVLPGYVHVSIGGTLSTVGWGAASFRYGPQIANCLSLEIVTGAGELVRCTPEESSELFFHALGGLGQFGVITKVRYRLRRFLPALRTYSLAYPDLDSLWKDHDRITAAGHAAHVEGHITREIWNGKPGAWQYLLNVSIEAERFEDVSDECVLADLEFPRQNWLRNSLTVEYLSGVAKIQSETAATQPWVVIFLPRSEARRYIEFCLANLPFPNLGGRGAIIRIWLGSRSNFRAPMLNLPVEDGFLLFALFVSVSRTSLPIALSLLSRATDLAVRLGGKLHLGCRLPADAARWQIQFGESWKAAADIKKRYDPAMILNPNLIDFEPAAAEFPSKTNAT